MNNRLLVIKDKEGKFGYIDIHGNVVIYPKYSIALDFQNEVAAVKLGSKYGFIDINDNIIVDFKYDSARNFSNGYAVVKRVSLGDTSNIYQYLLIDEKTLHEINHHEFTYLEPFSEGFAQASVERSDCVGFINTSLDMIIPELYMWSSEFKDGLASVSVDGYYKGFINTKGDIIIPLEFIDTHDFSNSIAAFKSSTCGLWGFLDKSGNCIIEPTYNEVGDFNEGLTWGRKESYKNFNTLYFINSFGDIVFNVNCDHAWSFSDGLCPVAIDNSGIKDGHNFKWGYINKGGEIVIDFKFDLAFPFDNGIARVNLNDSFGYIDYSGNFIWEP